MNSLVTRKIGVNIMIIDFTDEELDVIYDALDEMRISTDDEKTVIVIGNITNKMMEACENGG
jgi:hypothetical protein